MPDSDAYRPRVPRRDVVLGIRGIDHAVHEWGDPGGEPLCLLHGWGDCGTTFQFLVDALRGNWHVIAPDWRGFGDSAHSGGPYWFPDYLADLDVLLDRYDPDGRAVLVGHSMGGNVASLYAGIFPGRLRALVNLEGFGLPDSDPATAPDRYRRWIEAGQAPNVHPGYDSLTPLVRRIRQRSPALDEARARFIAGEWARQDDEGRWQLKADMAHRWPNPVLYRRAEAEACWRRIAAPLLLVEGADSELARAGGWSDRDGSDAWPAGRREVIAGAGHMLHFEQPASLAALIEDFLAYL